MKNSSEESRIHNLAEESFPVCRSIAREGTRETLGCHFTEGCRHGIRKEQVS